MQGEQERGQKRETYDDGGVPALDLGVLVVFSAPDGYVASLYCCDCS